MSVSGLAALDHRLSRCAIAYIALGGVKAVVWTNVFQASLFLVGGGITVAFLASRIDGGLGAMFAEAAQAGRLNVINWGPAPGDPDFWRRVLTDPNIVWLAVLNGLVGSTAAFGTDYDLMQRLLTVKTRRESQRTLSLTPIGTLVTLAIYLAIGAGLYTYYAQHPGRRCRVPTRYSRTSSARPCPSSCAAHAERHVRASIDSPLGSLATSFVAAIYRPLLVPAGRTPTTCACRASPWPGLRVLLAARVGFSFFDRILCSPSKIGGVTFGSLLGSSCSASSRGCAPTGPTWRRWS